jgi:hypothetical protein
MIERPSDLGIPEMTTWCSGDLDFHSSLGGHRQLPRRQCLAGQRFIRPIVVTNDGLDADHFELPEEILVHLLVDGHVALARLADGCRAGGCFQSS